jgi:DNA polymerase elongation subunit (family B)
MLTDKCAHSETNNIDYEHTTNLAALSSRRNPHETLENIIDIREYDIPYYLRVAIDMGKFPNTLRDPYALFT